MIQMIAKSRNVPSGKYEMAQLIHYLLDLKIFKMLSYGSYMKT